MLWWHLCSYRKRWHYTGGGESTYMQHLERWHHICESALLYSLEMTKMTHVRLTWSQVTRESTGKLFRTINLRSTWHCQGLSTLTFWWKLLCQRINLTHKPRMAHIFTGFCHRSLTVDGKHNKMNPSEYFSFPSKSFCFSCICLNDNCSRCVSMRELLHSSGLL